MVDGGDRGRPAVSAPVAALASIAPGPALAAALARVVLPALTGYETVLVLRARQRQVNHEQAMLLAAVDEVLRRDGPGSGRVDEPPRSEWLGVDEVRAALVLTRPAAKSLCELTADLIRGLPEVFAAMTAGGLDEARARVFHTGTEGLRPEHRRSIVTALLPRARHLTVTQLADEIRRAAIEADPQSFRRRYDRAVQRRRVEASLGPDGTGCLAGRNLPADQVNAAWDRLDAFARKLKHAGHPDSITTLQADLFASLLDGSLAGLDDNQILELFAGNLHPDSETHSDANTADGPRLDEDAGASEGRSGTEPGGGERRDGRRCDRPPTADPAAPAAAAGVAGPSSRARVRGRGLRLVAGLGTIAGRDSRPALLLGLGPVHAELARQLSAAPRAVWRFVLTAADRSPLDVGSVHTRPTRPWSDDPASGYEGIEVWLQATAAELATLRDNPPPGWDLLLTELSERMAVRPGGPPIGDPQARFPSAGLRRWIQIRDLHCTFPGCRVPAHHSEVDHLHEYAQGGLTIDVNLGLASAGCHNAKTTDGWTARASRPGHITWRSPLGHDYPPIPPPQRETRRGAPP